MNASDQRLEDLSADTDAVLKRLHQLKRLKKVQTEPKADLTVEDPLISYKDALEQAYEHLLKLNSLFVPRMFATPGPIWIFLLTAAVMIYPAYLLNNWKLGGWLIGVFSVVAGVPLWLLLWSIAKKKADKGYAPLAQCLADAEALKPHCRAWAKTDHDAKQLDAKEKRESANKKAEEKLLQKTKELEAKRDEELKAIDAKFKADIAAIDAKRDKDAAAAEEKDKTTRAESKAKYEADVANTRNKYETQKNEIDRRRNEQWNEMAGKWRDGLAHSRSEIEWLHAESNRLFVPWPGIDWDRWKPVAEMPEILRLGEFHVDTSLIPDITPTDENLKGDTLPSFRLPAFIPFPDRSSVILKAEDQGKGVASKLLQALMLRLMTAVPPGRVRFTILDPVTLGESFASFMHLVDIDEGLVTQRIWTEPDQMEAPGRLLRTHGDRHPEVPAQ